MSYTAPASLTVGEAIAALSPSTSDTDIDGYSATGLPSGLSIDATTGAISGTPDTADAVAATATVTVTDGAGNPAEVSIEFPMVANGEPTVVPTGWDLIPPGLDPSANFRLLIVTSTQQGASSSTIGAYDTVVRNDVSGNGHTAIQGYSSNFKMLGCTSTIDATTHTSTRSGDTAASIYWLNGAKVADDYGDFYDGNWDSNAPKYPDGEDAPTSGAGSVTFVGCLSTGLKKHQLSRFNPGEPGVSRKHGF